MCVVRIDTMSSVTGSTQRHSHTGKYDTDYFFHYENIVYFLLGFGYPNTCFGTQVMFLECFNVLHCTQTVDNTVTFKLHFYLKFNYKFMQIYLIFFIYSGKVYRELLTGSLAKRPS